MGYYMGDYYQMGGGSSFYRGDPFWGSLGRWAISGIGALLHHKTPTGAIVPAAAGRAETIGRMAGSAVGAVKGMIVRHPVLSAAGAAAVMGAGAGAGVERMMAPGAAHKGYHLSKARKGHPQHMVRNRRMNACNPRALRRAARRAHAFLRISRKLVHYYTPHKPKGRPYIRAKKRK